MPLAQLDFFTYIMLVFENHATSSLTILFKKSSTKQAQIIYLSLIKYGVKMYDFRITVVFDAILLPVKAGIGTDTVFLSFRCAQSFRHL